MAINKVKLKWKVVVAFIWLLFTSSLTFWWMIFAISLIDKSDASDSKHKTMLLLEGSTLLIFLFAGGLVLIYFILLEQRQRNELAQFFAAFSHDIKTAFSGVRLQAESLREDIKDPKQLQLVSRLLSDVSRLNVKLENSMFLAKSEKIQLFLEGLELKSFFNVVSDSWPKVEFEINGNAMVKADRRLLENIFNNIVNNAIAHGGADKISISISQKSSQDNDVDITISNNGKEFVGDRSRLGHMFYRQNPSSGSGLGLYTCISNMKAMHGKIQFPETENKNFIVQLTLPGEKL